MRGAWQLVPPGGEGGSDPTSSPHSGASWRRESQIGSLAFSRLFSSWLKEVGLLLCSLAWSSTRGGWVDFAVQVQRMSKIRAKGEGKGILTFTGIVSYPTIHDVSPSKLSSSFKRRLRQRNAAIYLSRVFFPIQLTYLKLNYAPQVWRVLSNSTVLVKI